MVLFLFVPQRFANASNDSFIKEGFIVHLSYLELMLWEFPVITYIVASMNIDVIPSPASMLFSLLRLMRQNIQQKKLHKSSLKVSEHLLTNQKQAC